MSEYTAISRFLAQSSVPDVASSATQNSRGPSAVWRLAWVKRRPLLTAIELHPGPISLRHKTLGGSAVQLVRMLSGELLSPRGPLYCGQSAAKAACAKTCRKMHATSLPAGA